MKRSLILFGIASCCAVFISGCEKDEPPTLPFLTVDMTGAIEGVWLFATNEKGELLDIVRADLTNRVVRQLKTNKRFSTIDLSVVSADRYADSGNFLYFNATTYRNIPATITVQLGHKPVLSTEPTIMIGTASIAVKNFTGDISDVVVTTHRGSILRDQISVTEQRFTANIEVLNNSDYVIISAKRNGMPVYYRQPLDAGNTTIEVDFSSFVPMENVQTLYQSERAFIAGLDEHGYRMPVSFISSNNYAGTSPITIGTVPGFPRYFSYLTKSGQSFLKVGSPIALSENVEEKFIDYSLNVIESNIKSFSFNFSSDYDYKVAFPYSEVGPVSLNWAVYASEKDDARMLFDIPEEIIQEFPELATYSIPTQGGVRIYKSPDGSYTYSDFLKEQLMFDFKSEFEQLIITR